MADIAIDLYALAACLSRTSFAIESRGEDAAYREINWSRMFAKSAAQRMRYNLAQFEDNDDELRKACAEHAYAEGRYGSDIL